MRAILPSCPRSHRSRSLPPSRLAPAPPQPRPPSAHDPPRDFFYSPARAFSFRSQHRRLHCEDPDRGARALLTRCSSRCFERIALSPQDGRCCLPPCDAPRPLPPLLQQIRCPYRRPVALLVPSSTASPSSRPCPRRCPWMPILRSHTLLRRPLLEMRPRRPSRWQFSTPVSSRAT